MAKGNGLEDYSEEGSGEFPCRSSYLPHNVMGGGEGFMLSAHIAKELYAILQADFSIHM